MRPLLVRFGPYALVLLALGLHAWHVRERAWLSVRDDAPLLDYATYDAAVATLRAGGDPYHAEDLLRHRRAPEPRVLAPFLYPPTFLVALAWTQDHPPEEAARAWFWLNEVALLAAALALFLIDPRAPVALSIGVVLAAFAAIPDQLKFGQANFVALLAVSLGLLAVARWRERTAGICFAVAISLKLLPAVILLPLIAARRGTAALWALTGTSVIAGLTIGAAQWAGYSFGGLWGLTQRYWFDVVPTIADGTLRPPFVLDVFPNHSLASMFARWGGEGGELVAGQRRWVLGASGVLLACVAWCARRADLARRPLALAALATLPVLLAPGYLFDHHFALVLPALVYVGARLIDGKAPGWTVGVGVLGLGVLAWSIEDLRARANPAGSMAEGVFWDLKTYAWLALFGLVLFFAARPVRDDRDD